MDARAIIAKLRDGDRPGPEDLAWFAQGLASGAVTDAQAGAFAMAVVLNGLGEAGRVALTMAMRDSGDVMAWDLDAPVVDKHSTGGIGDCVSLMLAPMLAAEGVYVPMISGRGLGHTGGTLDKLEAIPGLSVEYDEDAFRAIVGNVGCAIVAASADLAPADRRLYAVRDVTATVESVDLITASILSKKLAAGLEVLILDVKVGSGAFMTDLAEARALARALVDTANGAGCKTRALITDMDQPLASAAGNGVEVAEIMGALTGSHVSARLTDLSVELAAEILATCGKVENVEAGAKRLRAGLRSGAAAEKFAAMVTAMGGPTDFVERWPEYLPEAPVIGDVTAPEAGFITAIDGQALGRSVVHLGGGRLRGGDPVDPAVGLSALVRLGQSIGRGEPLALVHAASNETAQAAARAVRAAITIGAAPGDLPPLIHERVV